MSLAQIVALCSIYGSHNRYGSDLGNLWDYLNNRKHNGLSGREGNR